MANVKDVIKNGDRFVDVFFGRSVPTNVSFFLYGASPVKKCYKNETISFTEYTPTQKIERSITFSAEEQRQRCAQKRYDYIERFKRSKYADIELVDAIVSSESEKIAINAQFHIGELVGDYAATRKKHPGRDDFHNYVKTVEAIEKIVSEARGGAVLRVWYGHNARDLCGYMYLLDKLRDIDLTVIEFEAPEEIHRLNAHKIVGLRYWEKLRPEELCIPLSEAKILTEDRKNELLTRFDKLACENAEYRIYENGDLKSADFEYLRAKAIPHFYKGKFSLSKLMGRLFTNEEAFMDLCIISSLPDFIYRLVDAGDLANLGYRESICDKDCWLKSLR